MPIPSIASDGLAWRIFVDLDELPVKSCRLNRSMQHWLAVYSPAFESPRSLAGVD
jgi:hypothetical protein